MTPPRIKWFSSLFFSVGLLAACASNASAPITPSPVNLGVPHAIGPTDSVALAYDPTNDSLLKADRTGLFRWRADNGWQGISLSQTFGLSGIVVNPDQPTTIYASGPGLGVIRSDDSGQNWHPVNTGLPNLDVTALAVHSFRRDTLYVWLKRDGIYKTEDGAANWKRVPDQGPPDKDVRGLMHSTLEGSMNTGWLYASTPTGAYLSMDCF
jgi:photosystem II stability/assembly factor-like uncharacterized protein